MTIMVLTLNINPCGIEQGKNDVVFLRILEKQRHFLRNARNEC